MNIIVGKISSLYKLCRILSLDVALGGVVFTGSIAKVYSHSLPFGVLLSLFCSIWLIYSFDHLMDARRLKAAQPSMERHQFHQRHRTAIILAMLVVLVLGLFSLLLVPPITLFYGLTVLFVVLIYFLLSWKMKIFMIKEVLIASVYATGVLLGPVSLINIPFSEFTCLLIQIFGIALINLLILSFYERDFDLKDGQHSWAVKYGKGLTKKHITVCIYFLLFVQGVSFYWLWDLYFLQLILLSMTAVLFLIFLNTSFFKEDERYRSMSDLVFFLPGLVFWL